MTAQAAVSGHGSNWIVEDRQFVAEHPAKFETIFTQGNGYLGQRAALEEGYVGQTRNLFVCGTFDRFHDSEVSELPNLPDVTNLDLFVEGAQFSMLRGTLTAYRRTLNLYTGELCREVSWRSPQGVGLQMRWRRMVSLDNEHVIAAVAEVTADAQVSLTFQSGIDCRVTNSGTQHMVEGDARVYDDGVLAYSTKTIQSDVQVMTHTIHRLYVDGQERSQSGAMCSSRRYLGEKYTVQAAPGQTIRFEKISAVHTARDLCYADLATAEANRRVLADSLEQFRAVSAMGYDRLAQDSAAQWARYWDHHDICIDSADGFDQLAIRFAMYHLNIMTNHRDNRMGVGGKGLSGEGYKGHSFWDTEIFILPYFLYTEPQTARLLLEYRHRCLYGARQKARRNGYRGAMYPWEAAWIEDGDVTPDWLGVDPVTGEMQACRTGLMELHITADIAYAVQEYYKVTGDLDFMLRCGYEILLETALFWCDRLEWRNNRYEITHIIGPDEYQEDVNNNAYTNYMVAYNLDLGLQALDAAGQHKALAARFGALGDLDALRAAFRDCRDKIYLPQVDPKTGLLPQFDGYFDQQYLDLTPYKTASRVAEIMKDLNFEMLRQYQASKQADVLQLMYLREELFTEEQRRMNYPFYEQRNLHDSSLSKAIHSILASDLGQDDEAYAMFRSAAETDLGPEPDSCDAGIHSANMGGMWQGVVMGFGGVRCYNGHLRIAPHLPKHWTRLCFTICWQGRELRVTATHHHLRVCNYGAPVEVELEGRLVLLPAGGEEAVNLMEGGAASCQRTNPMTV